MSILDILSRKQKFYPPGYYVRHEVSWNWCIVCCKVLSQPAYIRKGYGYGLHEACSEKPGEIKQHPLHDLPNHTLRIRNKSYDLVDADVCDACRQYSASLKYSCKQCKFKLDFHCISNHDHEGQAQIKERIEKRIFYHPHKLQLVYIPSYPIFVPIFCVCCRRIIKDSAYACIPCGFSIHESCSDTIPKQFKSLLHPQHILRCSSLHKENTLSVQCHTCEASVYKIKFGCESCSMSFHISCAMRSRPSFKVSGHEHNLSYIDYYHGHDDCSNCNESCKGAAICRCMECSTKFHVECVLPRELTHECHHHTLTLTKSIVPKDNNPNEYLCDLCEKKGDPGLYVYHCEECYFIAHIECLLSEENPQLDDLEQYIKTKDDQEINESDEMSEEDNESDETSEGDNESDETSKGDNESDETSEGDNVSNETSEADNDEEPSESDGMSNEEKEIETGTSQQSDLENFVMKLDKSIKLVWENIEKELGPLEDEYAKRSNPQQNEDGQM